MKGRNKKIFFITLIIFILGSFNIVFSQSIEELMARGQQLLERGAYSEAITAFRSVVSREPDNFEAQFNMAFAYLQWGRFSNAVEEFKKALRYQPQNSEIWSNLAIAYENMGKSDMALGALQKSVQYNPTNITARINLAAMYHNANQFNRAIAEYKAAISIDGSNEEALVNLAKCLVSVGKFEEARQYLTQAIAANPNNGEAHWELGNIYWKKEKNVDKGINEYNLAISAQPSVYAFYESLASAYEEKGDKTKAIETLKNSLIYIDDALQKERIQQRIDKLELGDTQKSKEADGVKLTNKSQINELKKELREEEKKPTEIKKIDAKPVNVMDDLKDLNTQDESNPLDLTGELKKKKEEKKK